MSTSEDLDDKYSLDYHFTPAEVRILARFFRSNQRCIPSGLEDFSAAVEKIIYNNMSICEAEKFYS